MRKGKYKLVFENINLPAFSAEMVMRGGYDSLVITYEKSLGEAYVSDRNQKKLAKKGIRLYANERKVSGLISEGEDLSLKIKKFIFRFGKSAFRKKTNAELKEIFKKFYSLGTRFLRLYSFTEVIYSPEIDKAIRMFVYKSTPNKERANYIFSLLLNPSPKKEIGQRRDKILHIIKVPQNIAMLCRSVRKIGKKKIIFRSTVNQSFEFLMFMFQEIARRNYLSPHQVASCLYQNIMNLFDNKDINLDAVNRRSKSFVAFKRRNRLVFYSGAKAAKIISDIKFKIPKNIKEFSGDVASPGIARGIARILPTIFQEKGEELLRKKIKEMNKGEILVASTTGPELIMACRKAGAIVAEEGGINSHAAIISRELAIPGIVNTKIATRILQDGDFIEVDADHGIIRILKKQKGE